MYIVELPSLIISTQNFFFSTDVFHIIVQVLCFTEELFNIAGKQKNS